MNHAHYEELLALELYDEIDASERALLDQHVAGCAACTRLRGDLRSGLGRLRPERRLDPASTSSVDWDASLRRAVASETRSLGRRVWIPIAAAFAAGILGTLLVIDRPSGAPPAGEVASASPWKRFHTTATPPVASSSGSLAQLSSYLRD